MKNDTGSNQNDNKEETSPKNILKDLDKKDLEDMQHIFIQNDDEILDVPLMINKVHID